MQTSLVAAAMQTALAGGSNAISPIIGGGLTEMFKAWTGWLADWVELVAAVIIAFAVVEAAISALRLFTRRHLPSEAKEVLRLRLGRWLAVALEFELAADILRTAIAPTWNEIGLLAAVAGIRTALNYFLEQEIAREALRLPATSTPTRQPDSRRMGHMLDALRPFTAHHADAHHAEGRPSAAESERSAP